jgi:potassium efflux system protein
MLKFILGLFIAGHVAMAALAPAQGQATASPAAATNAATTNAGPVVPAPPVIAVGNVVAQAQAAVTALQDLQAGLDPDQALEAVNDDLPKLTARIDDRNAEDARQPSGTATLGALQVSQSDWQSVSGSLATEQKKLSDRVRDLDQQLAQLNLDAVQWKATREAAATAKAPPDIMNHIDEVLALIAAAKKAVREHQAPLYEAQNGVAAQAARAKSSLEGINKELDSARQQLLEQNRPTLWNPEAFAHRGDAVVQERASLNEQASEVAAYLKPKMAAVLIHILFLALLVIGFHWARSTIAKRAEKETSLRDAAHILDVPFANALLLALLAAIWLYPGQPNLLWAAFGATALVPAIIVTRRLIDPSSFPILYAAMAAFLVDQLRHVATPAGIVTRFLYIFELLAACVFLLAALRFKHLSAADPEQTRLKRLTRLYLHGAFFVFIFAGLANVFGYIKLSILIGEGMLQSSYLAVILYAAVRIVDALVISALSIRPLSGLGMVRRHHDLLYANSAIAIRWLFFAIWFLTALQFFQQRELLWQEGYALLWADTLPYFNITFTLGAILAFPITIWASFWISRFVRFVLQEEVYPHLQLGRGIPYAVSMMVHYTILLIGFFAAVAATGAPLSQFAFLAGAFGVGLGFGMQNIMNNFVSGIILLFERPVKVGDIIQMDAATTGTVERIGIRASVIRLTNGSELIVPNGNLISNPVTNWTLSISERLIEIPVGVTSKVDPQHVLHLLADVARANSSVLKNPPVQTLLVTFGGNPSFRVRAWIDSEADWMQITSDLSLAINSALARENITIS